MIEVVKEQKQNRFLESISNYDSCCFESCLMEPWIPINKHSHVIGCVPHVGFHHRHQRECWRHPYLWTVPRNVAVIGCEHTETDKIVIFMVGVTVALPRLHDFHWLSHQLVIIRASIKKIGEFIVCLFVCLFVCFFRFDCFFFKCMQCCICVFTMSRWGGKIVRGGRGRGAGRRLTRAYAAGHGVCGWGGGVSYLRTEARDPPPLPSGSRPSSVRCASSSVRFSAGLYLAVT